MPPTRLLLVRHGQTAGFMTGAYNTLTERGRAQASALGAHWATRGIVPDAVICGPQPRHRETLQRAREAAEAAGGRWPEAEHHPGFDEHDGPAVALAHTPRLAEQGDALARRLVAGERLHGAERARLFRALMLAWLRGEVDAPGTEDFPAFRRRVEAALGDALDRVEPGGLVAVFTSAGAVAAATGAVVRADDAVVMELSWSVLNGSTTVVRRYPNHDPALQAFNTTPHLAPELETYL